VQADRGRAGVTSAGWFAGLLNAVLVVAGAFHGSRAGAFGAFGDQQRGDLVEVVR
jgi:hypothetical protein